MNPSEYWQGNKELKHITPPNERFPEVGLYEALQQACKGSVFEFGCGDGRLSHAFNPSEYVGFDINRYAIEQARINNPQHQYIDEWQEADTVLAYTVLLHINDEDIKPIIEKMMAYKTIVIGEITGRHWRRGGLPPVFNREVFDYINMIGVVPNVIKVPYPRYNCELDLMVFNVY